MSILEELLLLLSLFFFLLLFLLFKFLSELLLTFLLAFFSGFLLGGLLLPLSPQSVVRLLVGRHSVAVRLLTNLQALEHSLRVEIYVKLPREFGLHDGREMLEVEVEMLDRSAVLRPDQHEALRMLAS